MSIYVDFDTKLCMQLQEGNEEAFAQAFTQYNRLLYAIAYRYLKSGEEAEDAEGEEYVACTVEIDGEAFHNIGLRAKGNNSLPAGISGMITGSCTSRITVP